jgi:serine protease Do
VAIDILRDGKKDTLYATLEAKSSAKAGPVDEGDGASGSGYGMTVQPLTPQIARELELTGRKEGVVIRELDPNGAAAAAGLQEGDVITQVNGKAVTSASELKSALAQSTDRPALLLVARKGGDAFVTLSRPRS